eukprot:g28417.t1
MTDACVYDDAAAPADVLFVPGGLGTRALQHDAKFVARLAELAARATVVLSATTNKVAFDEIASQHPSVQWQKAARWSVDGKFYTSSGVAAGIDLARFFLKELFSTKVAQMACNVAEYQHSEDADHDPFAHRTSTPGTKRSLLVERRDRREMGRPGRLRKPVLKNSLGRTLRLVLVAYDQFEMLDTFGPLEMFAVANRLLVRQGEKPAFELTSVAEDQLTKSFEGPVFCMDQVLQNATRLEEIDLLLLPGGIGTIREIYNPLFQHSIRALVESSQRVMTVCTGSAILGSAGLLENRRQKGQRTCRYRQTATWKMRWRRCRMVAQPARERDVV